MTVIKHSRQRDAIKNFLADRKDHPSADTIYTNLRKEYPNISLGTVYRNLALLCELGEIQKLTSENGGDRYDGNPAPHCHFHCIECSSVIDLENDNLADIMSMVSKNFSGHLINCSVNFTGYCESCYQIKNRSQEQ